MGTYTHTFKDGRKQDYDYKDIIDRAGQFYKNGSGSLDEITRAGLEYIAQGNDQYARLAQIGLSHWNNPEAVKNAYYNYNAKNGIQETPPTSVPTTSGGATSGGDTSGEDGKGDSKDWKSIIESIYAAYGKKGKSVKGKYETNLAAIDEQQRYAIELANQQRDEAVKRAYALNDQSQVTYGQNAERLAQMGLTNAGYGDYLTGVAYGNLVGGVERANVNADNAVRDAYYAAGQAKSQVYDAMHNELAAADKAYKDTLASIVTAVGSGEVDEKTAKAIAQAYGITEDEALTLIGDAATAYKDASNEGSIAVGPNTTNTDIDNSPDLTEEQKTAAKDERDKSVYEEETSKLQAEVASGNIGLGNITEIDQKYAQGNLGEDTYQHIYFDRALAFAQGIENLDEYEEALKQIDGYVSQDKMTSENAEKAKKYIAESVGKLIPSDTFKFRDLTDSGLPNYYFDLDGTAFTTTEFKSQFEVKDKAIKEIIDICLGDDQKSGFVVIGDDVYMRTRVNALSGGTRNAYNKVNDRKGADGKKPKEILLSLAQTSVNTTAKPKYSPIKE